VTRTSSSITGVGGGAVPLYMEALYEASAKPANVCVGKRERVGSAWMGGEGGLRGRVERVGRSVRCVCLDGVRERGCRESENGS